MKKKLILLMVLGFSFLLAGCLNQNINSAGTGQINSNNLANPDQAKIIEVIGKNFSFSPAEIKVKQGDKIKIVFINQEGFHDWKIDEFNAATNKINAGNQATVEFVADKTGTFEYYCSVGTHRQMGMVGKLIVQ
jgi:nitrite reductase (NO-forming)